MSISKEASEAIVRLGPKVQRRINEFTQEVLHTRGGRVGSGMGTLMEALWGYHANLVLLDEKGVASKCEVGWMPGQQYNDFACVLREEEWDPATKRGELFRIETKSMVTSADESKAHFDELIGSLGSSDLLVVLVWDWRLHDERRICPQIIDQFIGLATPIAALRDRLHIARGGTFVQGASCPDECRPSECRHVGEPLNASGKRERLSGPAACRVSQGTSYAANFGGMVRMLKTDSPRAREEFRRARREDDTAHAYITFVHRVFPEEEVSQYTIEEWRRVAESLRMKRIVVDKRTLVDEIRKKSPDYREILRTL